MVMKPVTLLCGLLMVIGCAGLKTAPSPHLELSPPRTSWEWPSLPPVSSSTIENMGDENGWGQNPRFLTFYGSLWASYHEATTAYRRVYFLKKIQELTQEPLELFWVDIRLYQEYFQAHLIDDALGQLRLAAQNGDGPRIRFEQSWLLFFEKKEPDKIGELLKGLKKENFTGDLLVRWNFLEQARHFRWLDIENSGLDAQISDLQVDYDDLWVSTWNGALGRYSLVSGDYTLFLKASQNVSPIRHIRISKYFVYVFRDNRIQRLSKVTGKWKDFALPEDWSGLRVQDVVLTGEDSFVAAHLGRGLWSWKAGQWTDLSSEIPSLFLNALLPLAENGWIVGSQDKGVFHWRPQVDCEVWASQEKNLPVNITFLKKVHDHFLAGTFGQGLWLLSHQHAEKVAEDKFAVCGAIGPSGFWWGTLDSGLKKDWGTKSLSWSVEEGFAGLDVTVMVSWKNEIIMGIPGKGIGVWNDED